MSDEQRVVYIRSLQSALSPNKDIRKEGELNLSQLEKNSNFLHVLLHITASQDVEKEIKVNAAIYFKNKVTYFWLSGAADDTTKSNIREDLCKTIYTTHQDSHLKKQLTEALYKILVIDDWPELCDSAVSYLSSSSFGDVYTGLLLIFQLVKSKRWSRDQDRQLMDQYMFKIMPLLTHLAENFVKQFNSDDKGTGELLYLILKIVKYATYIELPQYFNDSNNLSKWVQIHLDIISSQVPLYVSNLDDDDKNGDFRVKALKWSYANLHRLQSKYAGGMYSKQRDTDFAKAFNVHFVPVILNVYWKQIEEWTNKTKWLSDSSLFHMIAFLEGCCSVDESWNLVFEKFDAILHHLVFRSLCATDSMLELFEDDPEEYYRRYLDTNKDVNTADVAAINFIFSLCFKRFPQVIEKFLNLLNETFTKRSSDFDNLNFAKEAEGGLRVLSSISFKIVKKSSPVAHQIDQIIGSFILPELSGQNKFNFLKARACDVVASFSYTYQDMQVLSSVCQGCMTCFQTSESLPIQITSADALGTLITEKEVELAIAPHVTSIMERLLNLSNNYEFDVINAIMDDFVEKFALQLEPFSAQIAANLNEHLIRIGGELLDSGNLNTSTDDVDKEYQAIGILNTMMTMILSMNSSKQITLHLFNEVLPSIKFILENALVNFINEAMELLESCNVTIKEISPLMWEFFLLTLNSFDTYGQEFYEVYVPFLESCINYGFKNKNQDDPHFLLLLNVITNNISNAQGDSYEMSTVELSLELLYKVILTVDGIGMMLPQLLRLATSSYFKADQEYQSDLLKPFLKLFLSSTYKYPMETLKTYQDQEILQLVELWFNSESVLATAFDLKLQIMVIINLLKMTYRDVDVLPSVIKQAEPDLKIKLIASLQKLPNVVAKQQEILMHQSGHQRDIDEYDNGEEFFNDQTEEYEYDAEEVDLFKDILFDHLNVYDEFVNGFLKTGNIYNQFIQGISDPELINVVNQCISLVQ